MQITIQHLTNKFPEPEFSTLQRVVFVDIQTESAKRADVLCVEKQAQVETEPVGYSPIVRFGAYIGPQLVGWSFGWLERGGCFYMANSGVAPDVQGNGIYSSLLQAVLEHAPSLGAHLVRSQHSVLNNRVIACKLRRGFHITSLSTSAQMGTLVELVCHLSEPRLELFRSRVIPLVARRDET